jgi:hypothetical protein
MTLKKWSDNAWLRPHKTTPKEIKNLFQIVERDLKDSYSDVSADWRFGIAYNAALKLCTILLYAEGFKAERNLQHYRTIQALSQILGSDKKDDANYLDACRMKRNTAEYDSDELVAFVENLKDEVINYLKRNYPEIHA